ncbi:DUF6325 family protein [Streptacidiphilus jiangxiensis]|uniref:DUF1269 domain-containing protein n=1 Tax=Streptacidiphilus jiangxiensis TaxID=235985 RepID=A0A1H7UK04_STRJI|nr:DUF6325 family protein [Streptacidiphilus jiangxiensis]SEL97281.1 hypothetical protein SAMN05414137_1169 [Streptacidiphilus jiangxiensis]
MSTPSTPAYGPVEYAVIAFPGNRFTGEIATELTKLTSQGIVRVIDITFIKRDADGATEIVELEDLDDFESGPFADVDGEVTGLLSQEDLEQVAEEIPPNSSAAIIVWEDVWATALSQALRRADGILVAHERIPAAVVEQSVAAARAA